MCCAFCYLDNDVHRIFWHCFVNKVKKTWNGNRKKTHENTKCTKTTRMPKDGHTRGELKTSFIKPWPCCWVHLVTRPHTKTAIHPKKTTLIVNCFCFSFYQTIDQVKIELIGTWFSSWMYFFFYLSPSTLAFYGASTFRMTFTSSISFRLVDSGLNCEALLQLYNRSECAKSVDTIEKWQQTTWLG